MISKEQGFLDERAQLFIKQKEERGFSDDELWSLDKTIALFIFPRLKRFKEIYGGFPGNLSSEEWDQILDKMINSFNIYVSDKSDYVPIVISICGIKRKRSEN